MVIKSLFFSLLFCFSSICAQNIDSGASQINLMGKWKISKSSLESSNIYLYDFVVTDIYTNNVIDFHIGEYTGKKRVKFFSTKKKAIRNCGHRRSISSIYGIFDQGIWNYNSNTRILEIKHPRYSFIKQYNVTQPSSGTLLLTLID